MQLHKYDNWPYLADIHHIICLYNILDAPMFRYAYSTTCKYKQLSTWIVQYMLNDVLCNISGIGGMLCELKYYISTDEQTEDSVVYLYLLLLLLLLLLLFSDIFEVETVLHFTSSFSSARFMQFKQCFKAC